MRRTVLNLLIGGLVAFMIQAIRFTCRIQYKNRQYMEEALAEHGAVIATLWHGRLMMTPFVFPKKINVTALISAHKDGQIIAKTAGAFGIKHIRGSSSKGGATALREMIRHLKKGTSIFMTPDGPKGPTQRAQAGALETSRISSKPIIPVSISTNRGWRVGSWDSFIIPKPFSTITIAYGEPLAVNNKEERQIKQQLLEKTMNNMQANLDEGSQFKDIFKR